MICPHCGKPIQPADVTPAPAASLVDALNAAVTTDGPVQAFNAAAANAPELAQVLAKETEADPTPQAKPHAAKVTFVHPSRPSKDKP